VSRREPHEWLRGELAQWQAEGLIDASQAGRIAARYPAPQPATAWGTIVFSGIGAVVLGLGVILLFAYNWQAIPKVAKLALVFGAVGIAHAAGIVLRAKVPRLAAVGDSLGVLGTMLFGAGIWLVAQIYHIDEHFPRAFLMWGVGALLMALAVPSVAQGVLAAVLLTIWAGCERLAFDTPVWPAPVIIGLVLGWLAYAQRSRVLAAVVVPAFLLSTGFIVPDEAAHPWVLLSVQLSLAALLIAKSVMARRYGGFPEVAPIAAFYGWAVYLVILYLMSFPEMAHQLFAWEQAELRGWAMAYWCVPLVAAIAYWAWVAVEAWRSPAGAPERVRWEMYLVPLTVLLALADVFYLRDLGGWPVAGPFNLVLLGLAVTLMADGCRKAELKATALGSVLLVAVVTARYFDLFESLFIRGLTFLVIGGVLVAEGVLYTRARRQRQQEGRP